MDTFDGDISHFEKPGAGDDKLFVTFYKGILRDEAASIEAGRPIHRDTEFIRIITPGDKTNIIDQPVRPSDKVRFAQQYARFRQGADADAQIVGTRLSEWPPMSRALAEDLAHLGVKTVEQLAEVRDDVALRVPGLLTYKKQAVVWLERSTKTAAASKTAKLIEEQQAQIQSLQDALNKALRRLDEMAAGKQPA